MTSVNFTVDNINPLIQYTPVSEWSEGNSTDPLFLSYSNNGTFTLSTTQGASATFTFNGTQVYVFGAKRANHGPYSITLDGTSTTFDGESDNPIFGPLFVSNVLPQGPHKVTLTNQVNDPTKPFLDLDFITWTATVGESGATTTVEDTSSSFSYSPSTSWSTDLSTALLTGFSSNNGHVTQTAGASATVTFEGDSITVFGPVGPTISRYTVQLDGVTVGTFNATKEKYTPQVALYHADSLGKGSHTVSLISQPAVGGQMLAVDYAQVAADLSGTATASGTAASSSAPGGSMSPPSPSSSSKSNVGAAVGGAIGGVFVLSILGLLFFFVCRRKRRLREVSPDAFEDKYVVPPAAPSTYGMATLNNHAAADNAGSESQTNFVPVPHQQMSPQSDAPSLANPWGASSPVSGEQQRRTFYTVNNHQSMGTSVPSQYSQSDATSTLERSSTVHSSGAAGLGTGGAGSRKGAPLPLPPTANVPLPPGTEFSRMQVPGREVDYGPLPPDYQQATEPYNGYDGAYDGYESVAGTSVVGHGPTR